MEDTTVDTRPRVQIEISAHLADQLAELAEQLRQLHPDDDPTLHYALGYAVSSGLLSTRDEFERRAQTTPEMPLPPSPGPVRSHYRTLANPRARLEVAAA